MNFRPVMGGGADGICEILARVEILMVIWRRGYKENGVSREGEFYHVHFLKLTTCSWKEKTL